MFCFCDENNTLKTVIILVRVKIMKIILVEVTNGLLHVAPLFIAVVVGAC
jgi:hypothetical protein